MEVTRGETAEVAAALAKKYIKRNATVHTGEHPADSTFAARYDHDTVNHGTRFSSSTGGVSNNQAESYFARMRRMVIGQVHRVTPKYMVSYAREVAWREDSREMPASVLVKDLVTAALRRSARDWRGYWQRKRRRTEDIFEP